MKDIEESFVHLGRYMVEGRAGDAALLLRRDLPLIAKDRPDLGDAARRILGAVGGGALTRAFELGGVPNDKDTKLDLAKVEQEPFIDVEPIWSSGVSDSLGLMCTEHSKLEELAKAGVGPTRSALFVGPPGVGKTLAAKWLAVRLQKPLVTLDLAAVMSSLLGRTGINIRSVLNYAQKNSAVLLLDEFDSIAKRRDDIGDVGELKRLVNVLLQAIDDWPAGGLLVAATNHPELLDRAVWRRFERVVTFPVATQEDARLIVRQFFKGELDESRQSIAAIAFAGKGLADATRELTGMRRDAVTRGIPIEEAFALRLRALFQDLPRSAKIKGATALAKAGHTQRTVCEITGVSRDTLRSNGIGVARKSTRKIKER